LKGKSYFGYRFLLFIALIVAIANAAARGYHPIFVPFLPADDTSGKDSTAVDTSHNLRFPIHDKTGNPITDQALPRSIDMQDPKNVKKTFEYDADSNRYYFTSKVGNEYLRNPTYLTLDEYMKYKAKEDESSYFQRRLDGLMLFNKTPELPVMYKEGLFDRIFGSSTIQVKPQGNVDVTFGGNWQNIKNPALPIRAQKYGVFDFDMQMNINLLATVGDKLKLNISNNTKATFDYQNIQKLDYNGKEDEMLKKVEAGNVSFPLKSSLINGMQSLFGLKTQLQFGKLWVTGVVGTLKSARKSLTIQGGAQSQQIAIKANNYEENRNFLLAQYFRKNYNSSLRNYPIINSLVTINKVEVWVTNRTGAVAGVRDILCLMDLGEGDPYNNVLSNGSGANALPDNSSNRLYSQLQLNPSGRQQKSATNAAVALGLTQGQDFERTTARQLSPTEFTFNARLGYIMLNTQMNPDDVLGVAYRYTYKGKVYQVGEFASDLPPDTTNPKVLFLKLMKGTAPRTRLPVWDLMMKNVYALGGFGVSKDNFTLNILYQDPGGGEKRYMPEGPLSGTPFISLLNLDHLNAQNEPQPDGIFDFVEGITINTQQGKIIFPVLEPFGSDLKKAVVNEPILERRYIYQVLYDSTKYVAQQYQQNDRYIMRGSYKSSSSSDIFLGGFNIPQGSVSVSAGGTRLIENQDYSIEYGLGRIKILNTGILNSGVPINIQYEDNATFGFQLQNFMAMRMDYYQNKNLTLGGTIMRLKERPFTQKVTFGDDPIQNTVLGLDANFQKEVPAITRLVDKLPVYSSTAPSFINTNLEVAGLLPGHPKQINALDPEGSVYIDDFEGTSSSYDLKFPAQAWSLASTPFGAVNSQGQTLFPEASLTNNHAYGMNRARLAWYMLEPSLLNTGTSVPGYVKNDSNQHYIRTILTKQVFPNRNPTLLNGSLNTFDLGFYPKDRGPYNFDVTNIDPNTGDLLNPEKRWGGISRSIDNTDFEASNVQYVQFWVMDPFLNSANPNGGSLYINLGNVSEDVMKDSRLFFENGIPSPFDRTKMDTTAWGYVPKFEQQITRSFDNDNAARKLQDVGYDGLPDVGQPGQESEQTIFRKFLTGLQVKLAGGTSNPAYIKAAADPANDNFKFYRDSSYTSGTNGDKVSVLTRYKGFNNPDGNSPITSATSAFATSGTTTPESEDINRDNTMNESETYFQYRIDFKPNMPVGSNYVISIQEDPNGVKLPNGTTARERWYQFKIPIQNYDRRVGGISDFRSIRFIRMFMTGWQDSAFLRFASFELGRNQWRSYNYSLNEPGENVPQQNQGLTDFTVTSVSLEENGTRAPVPYALPPGVARQQTANPQGGQQTLLLNEQSLSLRACALQDGDARGVFKEVNVDMRQFSYLRMFLHAEAMVGQTPVSNADVDAFIRIGSDFTNNYYEYRTPLTITPAGVSKNAADIIWPAANNVNIQLQELVDAKKERDAKGWPTHIPYETKDSKGNPIFIIGNPNIGGSKNIMLGLVNPKKTNKTPGDDGLPKCLEVWFDEMRISGTNDQAGYAAAGKVSVQLADLGNVNLSGSMHTPGYGNIDQKIQQRFQDLYYQYNTSTNLSLGKLMPRQWGVQLPVYVGYTQNVSTPKYNPFDQDVLLEHELNVARNQRARDSIKSAAQDFTSIGSFNITNARIQGNSANPNNNKRMPWSVKNFDFTYTFNNQFKHNPVLELDKLTTQRYGVGYTYAVKTKSVEPLKNIIKSKSKWLSLAKDFNFTPLPSTFNMRNDLNRISQEIQIRNIDDGSGYKIPSTYYKNFTWNRTYSMRWELMKSVSLDYSATNVARIDEPYGRIDNPVKRDSLLNNISRFGKNNTYNQTFNGTYNVPLSKLPLTDWVSARLGYTANYTWTTAPPIAYAQGNTIGNTQTRTVTSEFNMTQLYNKSRWLKALNSKPRKAGESRKGEMPKTGEKGQGNADLRKSMIPEADKPDKPGKRFEKVQDDTVLPMPADAEDGKKDKKSKKDKKEESDTTKVPETKLEIVKAAFPKMNTANLTDDQLDSLVQAQEDLDRAKQLEEKKKKIAAKKARKKALKSRPLQTSPIEHIIGHALTIVNRVTLNLTETQGTILPGYMDSTRFMGVNNYSMAPGFDFVYGYQPDYAWMLAQANAGRLSRDTYFNAQFQQTYSRNLNAQATLLPHKSFRIDLTLTQAFSKSHSELYADTTYSPNGAFEHLTPYETGSFNITYISAKSMFRNSGVSSSVYNQFLDNRVIISRRLGANNPYTGNIPDPYNPSYTKGYGPFSQDVLIPSFIAAYAGNPAQTAALLDYTHETVKANPFRYFTPMPNWRVTYNGLSKLPFFSKVMNNFVVNHAYTGTLAMNSFNSSLLFRDLFGLGYPSFIDSNSRNYIPYFQVPNVTITQAFNPLIGFDAGFKNNLTAKFEVRRSKTQSLSLIDYQVGENSSTEYVIGGGFRKKGIVLPAPIFGIKKLKNELIFKLDIGIRDDKTSNTFLANNVSVTSRGQKVIRVSPTINYAVTDMLTLLFFFDRQQTLPYVSNAFPTTTTRGGVTLRFVFAQ
jgi:cell surface protein SprA